MGTSWRCRFPSRLVKSLGYLLAAGATLAYLHFGYAFESTVVMLMVSIVLLMPDEHLRRGGSK